MIILGIETSCDETAVSIVEAEGTLESLRFKMLGSAVHSQIDIHREFGGVVPNLAKREHQKNLPVVLAQALKKADRALSLVDMIAVTVGPGLEPALWVGIKFAEELGKKLGVPVIGTNHMEGHIASVLLSSSSKLQALSFPALALLISGGHTELIYLKSWIEKEKIGETKDDAVGEAFDKVARMLGLPYPGGPEISRLAEQARNFQFSILPDFAIQAGFNFQSPKFPRPMIHSKDFDFSFSGLKTAVLYYLKGLIPDPSPKEKGEGKTIHSPPLGGGVRGGAFSEETRLAVAREFEDAVIETLVSKTKAAIEKYNPKTLIIGGGVIANKALRESFLSLKNIYSDMEILIPEKSLTTDNATMIAMAGFIEHLRGGGGAGELQADGKLNIK